MSLDIDAPPRVAPPVIRILKCAPTTRRIAPRHTCIAATAAPLAVGIAIVVDVVGGAANVANIVAAVIVVVVRVAAAAASLARAAPIARRPTQAKWGLQW